MRTDIEYRGFSAEDEAYLRARLKEEYSEAYTYSPLLLSETEIARTVSLALDLADHAVRFAPYATPLLLVKLLKEGKAVNEGIDGWISVFRKLFPGRNRSITLLKDSIQAETKAHVELTVGANVTLADKRLVPVWPLIEGDPDEVAFILTCLKDSLQRAVKETEKAGLNFNNNIRFQFKGEYFVFRWHNWGPSKDLLAYFDLDGRLIGEPLDDFDTQEIVVDTLDDLRRALEASRAEPSTARTVKEEL